ncbi:MAG: GNAT family N-acetyltransferase [Alphaproteobacteria bacterium]
MIRPATLADASPMARVYVRSWRSSYGGIVPRSVLSALSVPHETTYWRDALRRPPPGRHALVAERRGQVVGFATCGRCREGVDDERLGEVYTIYLLADAQRQGLGRRLLAESAAQMMADGIKRVCIWVLRDNPARQFYDVLHGELDGEKTVSVAGAPLAVVRYLWDDVAWLEEAAAELSGIDLPGMLTA